MSTMEEKKVGHTPGPWRVREDERCLGYSHVYGGETLVCSMQDHASDMALEQDPAPHECKANARLIAAAPDLLVALQAYEAALSHMESWEPDMNPEWFREVSDELYAQAETLSKAALAKAGAAQ